MSLNEVMLIGRLGADPEIRYTQDGKPVATFRIATNRYWNEDGERKEKTDWHRIVAWNRLAEIAGEYLEKGRLVYVEGRLETRSWEDQDGIKRWVTEIIARDIQMLDSRGGEKADTSEPPTDEDPPF